MIRRLPSGKFRLYSRKIDPRTLRRRNLGTFDTLDEAKQHEREMQRIGQGQPVRRGPSGSHGPSSRR